MKRLLILAALALMLGGEVRADFIVAGWTFETLNIPTSPSPPTTGSNSPVAFAENGTQQSVAEATGFHSASTTTWTTPSGNGSVKSLNSNTWSTNDYYQFRFSTLGISNVKLTFDQTRSSTGPASFKVQWSSNGTNFTDFLSYSVIQAGATGSGTASWSSTTNQSQFTTIADLSSITQINSLSNAYIRLTNISATSATGGTNRIDNVTITGVPEPTSGLLIGLGTLACVALRRNRRVA
jgi:hypothetical protein